MKLSDNEYKQTQHQIHYQKNKPKQLAKSRKQRLRKYGLTEDDYNKMLVAQDYKCAICKSNKPGGRGRFHVDHCHKTGKVRKLLCTRCNTMLGMVNDDITILEAGIDYLRISVVIGIT